MRYSILLLTLFLISCDKDTPESPEPSSFSLDIAAANPQSWTWIPKDNMFSRDGSNTGYIANLEPSASKLLIYLQGGGACFNSLTCTSNPSSFGEPQANEVINQNQNTFLFNRNGADNPFDDWNYVFVPYSTGDVHSGSNNNANVINGPTSQNMSGYNNFKVVIEDLKAYFEAHQGVTDIILAGGSAGSFGTYLNFIQTAEAFGSNINLTILADSGVILFDEDLFNDCLNTKWTDLWNFDFPSDLEANITGTYSHDMQKIYEYNANKYPNANFGLVSSYGDDVMRFYWGFGRNGCNGFTTTVTAAEYKDAIQEVENVISNFDNWKVFYTNGEQHTFLLNSGANYPVDGTTILDWMSQLHNGTAISLME